MPIELTMPRLSDTMQAGTVVKWNVSEGQAVKAGDVVADIETDKATMDLPTYDAGTVARLMVPEGQSVPVGTVIMLLAAPGEDAGMVRAGTTDRATASSVPARKAEGQRAPVPASAGAALAAPGGRPDNGERAADVRGGAVIASPLARKIAEESGVDLGRVRGSGPGGRIVRRDVEAARVETTPASAGRQPATAPPGPGLLEQRIVPVSSMRRVIAARLAESKQTIPHYQVSMSVEMDALAALRDPLNSQLAAQGVKLSVNDFLVRACALAMHRHPYVNSRWIDAKSAGGEPAIELVADVNIGVAIALPEERGGGLVVGTVRHADLLGLRQISAESNRLSDKARAKGLSIDEMADSTFTLSNLGMFGVDHFTAIINPPNVAIMAVGAAVPRAIVRDGQVTVARVMTMTLSSDHRVVDGAMAARYLGEVKKLLEAPATLLV